MRFKPRDRLIGLALLVTIGSGLACSTREKDPQVRLRELIEDVHRLKRNTHSGDAVGDWPEPTWRDVERKTRKAINFANEQYRNDSTKAGWIKEGLDTLYADALLLYLNPGDSIELLDTKITMLKVTSHKNYMADKTKDPTSYKVAYKVERDGKAYTRTRDLINQDSLFGQL